jgi:hypothetical protein
MTHTEKIYHIYAKEKCLFHSLKEEEFEVTWNTLKNMIDLIKTEYQPEDLTFEELTLAKKVAQESSY